MAQFHGLHGSVRWIGWSSSYGTSGSKLVDSVALPPRNIHYFADNCIKKSKQNLDDTEFLEVTTYKKEEIDKLIQNNQFQQAIHIMAWLLLNK